MKTLSQVTILVNLQRPDGKLSLEDVPLEWDPSNGSISITGHKITNKYKVSDEEASGYKILLQLKVIK